MFVLMVGFVLWAAVPVSHGVPIYEPVGCFLDSGISPRSMPLLLKNFRPEMKWDDIAAVIDWCAGLAHDKSLGYFGLQNYGECWSGETADQNYSRDGSAEDCKSGVGLSQSTYFVYKFHDYGDKVPGCKEKWKMQNNICFRVMTNDSSIKQALMNGYCHANGEELVHAVNKSSFRLVEQLLYTMQLNSETNSSRCVVIGPTNASSYAALPRSQGPVFLGATHTCAVRDSNKWKLEPCFARNCDYLCMAPRDTNPVAGTLMQLATDAAITGHVIKKLLVDDVITCARECLLYLNCLSVNYEYKPTADREFPSLGMICELNDETKNDVQLNRRFGYNYYERLHI